ncbi:MAG: FKBP-type peptidyl-prolyl cis-trans isomerase [Rhabdochlamydiaceae bacterium]|nr:FKBP-type peptidyl-prolyl cis-trans isomerase [Candidatus Amphrikana amoebophyrae]
MEEIQPQVRVHYEVKEASTGELIDKSEKPFEFTPGNKEVIPGFEAAVLTMKDGETREVEISAEEAYGNRSDELIREISKEQIPSDLQIEEGMRLQIGEDEEPVIVTVINISDDNIVVDGNHPLAGIDLHFTISRLGDSSTQ